VVPQEKPTPEKATILAHLLHVTRRWHELNQPLLLETVFLTADDAAQVKNVAHFRYPDQIEDAADHIAAMNPHRLNAYATPNPVDANNPPQQGRRASAEHIVASFFHWGDADSEEAAENIRNFVGPKPTLVIITGTQPFARPHVYWELDEPTRNMPAWSQTQRAIAATLKTDAAVIDPPRIMRVAGTINWPKPKKQGKGYIAERCLLTIHDPDKRPPVTSERMARAFAGQNTGAEPSGFTIDTGPQSLDRERTRIQALEGQDWHNAVIRLVASYVSRGLSDDEIHGLTSPLTLPGYTVEQTHREVQTAINGARAKGWTPQEHVPNFDHAPAPTATDPAPTKSAWKVQTAADFTADFVSPEYLIDGIVQRGRLYTLTAPTGSGKTAVMLYAATAIASGMQFCGVDVEQGDVLFLAGENPDDVRARVIATMDFYGIDTSKCRLHFIAGTFSIRADLERLREEAAKLPNLLLVVVDTFAAYFDGEDENSNAQALDFARVVRRLTAIDSKPAVIMPAHPVKNATRQNLAPKGGSSLVNEVDGNLTLWNSDGLLSMHWQVKHRGPDFEPLTLELDRKECDRLKDRKGRIIPTILAKPVLEMRAIQLASERLSIEDRLLLNIADDPSLSQRQRCLAVGITRRDGTADTARITRVIGELASQKLIRKFRTKWELTKDGERAVDEISGGEKLPPEVTR